MFPQEIPDALPIGLLVTDAELRVTAINRLLAEGLAVTPEAVVGKTLAEAFPEVAERGLLAAYDLVRQSGQPLTLSHRVYHYFLRQPPRAGSALPEMPQTAILTPRFKGGRLAGFLVFILDFTDSVQAERALERQIDRLNALHEVDRALTTLDLDECLQVIVRRARALFTADSAAILLRAGEALRLVAEDGVRGMKEDLVLSTQTGFTGWAVRQRKSVLAPDVFADDRYLVVDPRTRSEMVAPLLTQEDCLGALNVESHRVNAFDADDMELLETLAARAAASIYNANLFAEAQRRAAEQRRLYDAARDFSAGLEEAEVLTAVVKHMLSALRMAGCVISRWEAAQDAVVTWLSYDAALNAAFDQAGASYALAEYPVTRQVLNLRQPVIVRADDPQASPPEVALLIQYGYASALLLPLVSGEHTFGLVELYRRADEPAFSEADVQLAQGLTAQAGVALENARLHTAERVQRIQAETLRDIGMALTAELDPDAVLDLLLDHVARVTPYDSATVMRLEDGRARAWRTRGYEKFGVAELAAAIDLPLHEVSNLRRMAETRQPHVVPDTASDADWVVSDVDRHIGSWAGAPIVARGRLLGILSLDKVEPNFYTPQLADRLAAFTAQAGLALENAELYAEQKRLAVTDGLTGLPNRRRFDAELVRELDRSARFQRPTTLVLLDIDNFKQYNDTYGHPAGDVALKAFGEVLRHSVRVVDIPARYGGEEFALILPETDVEAAREVAERLRQRVAAGDQLPRPITISLGLAAAPAHASTPESLLQAADRALYVAKTAGKNRTVVYR